MKTYTIEGKTYKELPNPLRLSNGDCYSPVTEALFEELGGVIEDDGEILTPEQKEFRDSECCVQFRALVNEVKQKIDDPDFYGAYETIPEIRNTEYAKEHPNEMAYYTSLFSILDNWCKKDAGKYGWGSPEWFYICWNQKPPEK